MKECSATGMLFSLADCERVVYCLFQRQRAFHPCRKGKPLRSCRALSDTRSERHERSRQHLDVRPCVRRNHLANATHERISLATHAAATAEELKLPIVAVVVVVVVCLVRKTVVEKVVISSQ